MRVSMATVEQIAKAQAVFALMSGHDGPALSMRKACEQTGVKVPTLLLWVSEDEKLAEQYARARESLLDWQAAELDDIGEEAAEADNAVKIAGLRLKSDNRKWLLSKLAPKKYGDKLALGGAHDLPPIKSAQVFSDEQLAAIIASK